jgi:hypothetical protein
MARIELDRANGRTLLALRAIDYRYRLPNSIALTAFLGAARYDLAIPAYGYYAGAGVQWRDIRPRWDLNIDLRYADQLTRDTLGPDGTISGATHSAHDVMGLALYVSRRF